MSSGRDRTVRPKQSESTACEAVIGNLRLGLWGHTGVDPDPDGHHVLVLADGHRYMVDPIGSKLVAHDESAILAVWPVAKLEGLLYDRQGLAFGRLSQLLSLLLLTVPAAGVAQEPATDTVSARGFVKVHLGDRSALVPRDWLLRWRADSVPLRVLLARLPQASVRCPMPVSVPVHGRAAAMPIARAGSVATVPMPTDTTACFNPLYRQR